MAGVAAGRLAVRRDDGCPADRGTNPHSPSCAIDDVPRPGTTAADIVALVERGDVELRTSRHDLGKINEVAERLEHGEIEGRAVVTP